jgi:hypothetical protein
MLDEDTNWGARTSRGLGRREEGLDAIQDAVAIRRRLAGANPATYEPVLASSLNNLSIRLGEVGRHDEAEDLRNESRMLKSDSPSPDGGTILS